MTARERWDETRALIEAGQDTDILAPGLILFPNGGRINVHQVRNGTVYYARRMPDSEEWELFRNKKQSFLDAVALYEGYRTAKEPPPDSRGPMSEIDWTDTKQAQHDGSRQIYGGLGCSRCPFDSRRFSPRRPPSPETPR